MRHKVQNILTLFPLFLSPPSKPFSLLLPLSIFLSLLPPLSVAHNKTRQDFLATLARREFFGTSGIMILSFQFKVCNLIFNIVRYYYTGAVFHFKNAANFDFGAGDHIGILPPPLKKGGEKPRERW